MYWRVLNLFRLRSWRAELDGRFDSLPILTAIPVFLLQNHLPRFVWLQKAKLSCIRTESDSSSGKLSRQNTSKPSKSSNHQSDCSQDHKCQCCFKAEKKRNKERDKFNDVTFKANYKYKNTTKRNHSGKDHENNRVSSLRRETKTAQTLSFVVGGFVACWLPFFLYYLLTPFIPSHYVNAVAMYVLTWLGWFNSAINPFIYAFYSPDFRVAFWRLTIKKCKNTKR